MKTKHGGQDMEDPKREEVIMEMKIRLPFFSSPGYRSGYAVPGKFHSWVEFSMTGPRSIIRELENEMFPANIIGARFDATPTPEMLYARCDWWCGPGGGDQFEPVLRPDGKPYDYTKMRELSGRVRKSCQVKKEKIWRRICPSCGCFEYLNHNPGGPDKCPSCGNTRAISQIHGM